MYRSSALFGLVSLAAILSTPADAQGRSRDTKPTSTTSGTSVSASVTVVFRDADRVTFRDYFRRHAIVATPLPPGIAKNVARGKPLPPGIAKRAVPPDLVLLGPKVGRDVSFAIVGDVVVATRAGVVIDVLVGVFK